jgi:hypothetical protein
MDVGTDFEVVGRTHDPDNSDHALMTAVSGDYATVLETPVLSGRMITDDDGPDAPYVSVINDALARSYFSGTNPIGHQIEFGGSRGMTKPYTIVGVIGDEVHSRTSEVPRPFLMLPYRQVPAESLYYPILIRTFMNFVVRTRSDIALAPQVRAAFKEIAPDYALDDFQTMQEAVDKSSSNQRVGLYLITAFAIMAILMVVTGLYGVLSQITGYRKREFGIRLALGATPSGIRWLVLRQALLFVCVGLAGGLAVTLFCGNLIRSFLYGVTPFDMTTIAAVCLLLLVVGGATALTPASRGAAVDPMTTLRSE